MPTFLVYSNDVRQLRPSRFGDERSILIIAGCIPVLQQSLQVALKSEGIHGYQNRVVVLYEQFCDLSSSLVSLSSSCIFGSARRLSCLVCICKGGFRCPLGHSGRIGLGNLPKKGQAGRWT